MSEAPRAARVIVASTSAAAGKASDTTGPLIAEWLREHGFTTGDPSVVADGDDVARAVRSALAEAPAVIVTTGGTGVSPSDRTPEAVEPLLEVQVPGLIEELRRRGVATLPAAVLTRGVAGFAGSSFIITLPGSAGGVRDGLAVLETTLEHVLAQRSGGTRSHDGHAPRR
ncbi:MULTISPECIES: molybdopterin-binding protein [unclassified Leucobacter]|uniref:molybdopterin-binding protein n=1 Tax=unclassified Leucobacter TaxID=2621730 RepID=UPI0019039611